MKLDNQPHSWTTFQQWLTGGLDESGPPGGSEHWAVDEEVDVNEHDEVIEMLQTGSVTTSIAGRKFEIMLVVKEIT